MTNRIRGVAVAFGIAVLAAGASPSRATMPPRSGKLPAEVSSAFQQGLFELPSRPTVGGTARATATASGQAVWRIPVILVSYSDSALVYGAQDFNQVLFDTTGVTPTGSVFDYYQWASGGRVRVVPTVVATVTLPNPRSYYGWDSRGVNRTSTPHNDAGLVNQALLMCSQNVEWTAFDQDHDGYVDMLWVVHAGVGGEGSADLNDLWSITSRLSTGWSGITSYDATVPGGPRILIDRFSILPEMSLFSRGHLSEIGVYCHEFGHALGLPDLYDTVDQYQRNSGPGNWSLMSTGAYGGDGISPQFPSHPGAWCSVFLGWSQDVRPAQDTVMTLPPIQGGGPVLELWFQGQSNREHFLVEDRKREGFDRRLPGDGLIVYHVDDLEIGFRIQSNTVNAGIDPALVLVEADGRSDLRTGADDGTASDAFPGALDRNYLYDEAGTPNTCTFHGAPTNVALLDITPQGGGTQFLAQVRAPGWQPPQDRTNTSYDPVSGLKPGNTAVIDDQGNLSLVSCEYRSGHAQVVLHTRSQGVWQPELQLSQSTTSALDPSIALLPGGDLAVAWSDSRSGHSRLYYRCRAQGTWTTEQQLLDLPGESLSPAIGADTRGTVQVAWLNLVSGHPQVMLMRFGYLSPFGQAMAVTGGLNQPGAPALAVAPDGASYVVWPDQSTIPQALRFARFHPDSGLGPILPLTSGINLEQSVFASADSSGALHTTWIVSYPGSNEIHYQRRGRDRGPSPADTTLEHSASALQYPRLAVDPEGGVHLAFQSLASRVSQVFYKRFQPARGWDAMSTEITPVSAGSAQRPVLAASSLRDVSVLYTLYAGTLPRFMERQRTFDLPVSLDVPLAAVIRPAAALALGPNPLRAGQALQLSWAGPAPGPGAIVEFYDLAGRRVAELPLAPVGLSSAGAGVAARGSLGPRVTGSWPTGIYFARVRGSRGPASRLVFLR